MANERNGMDSTSTDWSFPPSQAFLPPRSPLFAGGVPGTLDNINNTTTYNSSLSNWPKAPPLSGPRNRRHHRRTPSTSYLPQTPAWVDELLNDTPDLPPPKNAHRRSSSDSLAFWETPLEHVHISDIAEEEEQDSGHTVIVPPRAFRDDEWMKFTGNGSSWNKASDGNAIVWASPVENRFENSPALSDRDSATGSSVEDKRSGGVGNFNNDTEEQSVLKADSSTMCGGKGENLSSADASLDPKRAKRILANRQSAQRSRVRKLQYIAELERTVNVLQEEVSALSPQVTFLDRHRILLNVDNSAMKQRVAALAQEKLFKDAHNEALKLQVDRLRQLYQQQQRKHVPQPNISETIQQKFTLQLELKDLDVGLNAFKCTEYVSKDNEADLLESHAAAPPPRSPPGNPVGHWSCSSSKKGKVLSMPGLEHTDFRVQNP